MQRAAGAVASAAVLVGRQPIWTGSGDLYGYELLFRPDRRAEGCGGHDLDGDAMTTATMVSAFTEFDAEQLLGGRAGFVNLTRAFLVGELPVPIEPGRAVLEILETITVDDAVVAGVRRLVEQGFQIALDDFVYFPEAAPLLELASIVKVDVLAPWTEVLATVEACRPYGVTLLAERVETEAMWAECRSLGFELFQGYLLGRPETMSTSALVPEQLASLQLLSLLCKPGTSLAEIEREVSTQPALALKILRLANSASAGLGREIASISDALVLIGTQQLRGWVTLLCVTSSDRPFVDVSLALVRARACYLLAERKPIASRSSRSSHHVDPDTAFTLGMLHGVGELLGLSGAELCAVLPPLTPRLTAALRGDDNALRRVLDVVLGHESRGGVPRRDLELDVYLESLAWSGSLTRRVTS